MISVQFSITPTAFSLNILQLASNVGSQLRAHTSLIMPQKLFQQVQFSQLELFFIISADYGKNPYMEGSLGKSLKKKSAPSEYVVMYENSGYVTIGL